MQVDQVHPRDLQILRFGRKGVAMATAAPRASFADDLKLFALTFAGGFTFMCLYLA